MNNKWFKILNIIEPILMIITIISGLFTVASAFSQVNWVSLGGQVRESYWYEDLLLIITLLLPIVIFIIELIIFFKIKNNYKLYTVIYFIIIASIFILVGMWYSFGAIILLLLSNILKCVYRITKITKIIK